MFEPKISKQPRPVELREHMLEAADYLVGLQTVARESRDANWERDVRSAVNFVQDFDPILAAYEAGERGANGGVPSAGTAVIGNPERRSAGALFTGVDGYSDFAGGNRSGATYFESEFRGSLLVDNHEVRTLMDSTADTMWNPKGTPSDMPVRTRQARLFMRDLLSVQGTNLPTVPYIRELNAVTNELGATAVTEGTAKPEVVMVFEQDDAPIRKIAAWIPATTEIIDDAETLRGYIDTRLAYMLAIREEQQLLNGTGTAPQLKGILNYSGLLTQAFNSDVATTLGLAMGAIENIDGEVDGVAMNPVKYWVMNTTRPTNQFDNGYGAGAPNNTPTGTIWGVPVVRSRSLTLNQAVVGAFKLGATLFDRQQTTIRVGNQHSTYFTENKIAILAEERVGLAVHRPDFFCLATLA